MPTPTSRSRALVAEAFERHSSTLELASQLCLTFRLQVGEAQF